MLLQQHVQKNSTTVYKVKFNNTGKVHIGNTQQNLKLECKNTSMKSKNLSNLARNRIHTPNILRPNSHDTNLSPFSQQRGITCSIIWHDNPISAVKTFATKNCVMCAKERIAILKQSRSNPQLLVNSNNEISSGCRHMPGFHRCAKQTTPSTDESGQSMTKEPAQQRKLPWIFLGAMFAKLMSDWKHCEFKKRRFLFIC